MFFPASIDYAQISVCDSNEIVFSIWNQEHVEQGFVWKENHISFGIPDHDGLSLVETQLVTDFPPVNDNVLRAIEAPLSAPHGVTIATIMEDYPINNIPPGEYDVQFRLIKSESAEPSPESGDGYTYHLQFLFRPGKNHHVDTDKNLER